MLKKVEEESVPRFVLTTLKNPRLRRVGWKATMTMLREFFLLQFQVVLFKKKIPISSVDHPLDIHIPFNPKWVRVYLGFVAFWIRAASFLYGQFGRRATDQVAFFIQSIGELYRFAASVYRLNLSTTKRPRFLKHPRFLLIHFFDPHLLCVPSLHVMIVIRTYTHLRSIIQERGKSEELKTAIEEVYRRAIEITEAVLYVKQHSVNCIPAALYAMTSFDPLLFPKEEAERFVSQLFLHESSPSPEHAAIIRNYILTAYENYLMKSKMVLDWRIPILEFISTCPIVS
ncbi:hypothetical protein MASR2M78_26740 [Treponema sp.]